MAVVADAAAGLHAIELGASILQLRAALLSARDLETEAVTLVTRSAQPVLISARTDIALASRAAGVNLPEKDYGVADARLLLGEAIVGRSVHTVDGAVQAEREGADYVIFGPVWASTSHRGGRPQGLGALAEVTRAVRIPVLAIGGLNPRRAAECFAAGAAGYAAIRMFR